MLYLLLHNEVAEFPTAVEIAVVDDLVELMDQQRQVVARFEKSDVIAYSSRPERLRLGLKSRNSGPAN